ncbi:hypothetical protein BKA59DRAFT_477373 [Fusarium tricinctum]|uniref:Secreted protein n=1 Tax=Fusarium tricinctum TaxID=61284 RepID=A0A8K0RZ13_9HYPO|nr:hypothetical protein BKA59DRAFT_477373 [Fusarium tricinctum]
MNYSDLGILLFTAVLSLIRNLLYPQTNAYNYNRTTHYVTLMEQATHGTPRTQVTTHSVELARIPPVSTALESSIYIQCRGYFLHNICP